MGEIAGIIGTEKYRVNTAQHHADKGASRLVTTIGDIIRYFMDNVRGQDRSNLPLIEAEILVQKIIAGGNQPEIMR